MMATDSDSTRACPFCGETIPARATQCKFCREKVEPQVSQSSDAAESSKPDSDRVMPFAHAVEVDSVMLFRVRPSLLALIGPALWCALIIVIGGILVFLPLARIPLVGSYLDTPFLAKWKTIIGIFIAAAAFLYLLVQAVFLKSTVYSATNDRIEWERGIFSRPVDNIDLFRIDDLKLHRPFIDRLLGIGTVEVFSSDKTTPKLILKKIPDPRKVYDALKTESLRADRRRAVIHTD